MMEAKTDDAGQAVLLMRWEGGGGTALGPRCVPEEHTRRRQQLGVDLGAGGAGRRVRVVQVRSEEAQTPGRAGCRHPGVESRPQGILGG